MAATTDSPLKFPWYYFLGCHLSQARIQGGPAGPGPPPPPKKKKKKRGKGKERKEKGKEKERHLETKSS